MTFNNKNFYFETSAVNYLVDKFSWKDAIATKGLQSVKGNIWYLSPITLWEIMLTSDEVRREKIIFLCQHLFHEKLMNSPAEFIVNYIYAGCPLVENKYDFHSKLPLSITWADVCQDKRKTLVYDFSVIKEKTKIFQNFSKQLDKIIHRVILDITIKDDEFLLQQFANHFYNQVKDELKNDSVENQKIIKISILFIFYTLCLEADLDSTPYNNFWERIGIKDTIQRLNFITINYKDLIFRGPFYQMAIMAYHQITLEQKSNRGLFMDCLHSIYITYADIFITNDEHFKTLKEKEIHPNFSKIHHINEIEITTQLREIFQPDK